jgi:3D (Asp-Asp-Asp) domain-containing protein
MKKFKEYIFEKYIFGATAYGNADIDKTTASEIKKGIIKPEWQFLGNRNNKLIIGYSVANNILPHGTIVQIIDKRTGKPVGSQFGNTNGIYRVDDTGGSSVKRNIDFYSGSNREMYNYFANLGKNSGNLLVKPLNIEKGSEQEKQIIASINSTNNIDQKNNDFDNKGFDSDNFLADLDNAQSEDPDWMNQLKDYGNDAYSYVKNTLEPTLTDFSADTAKGALKNILSTAWGAIASSPSGKKVKEIISNYRNEDES